MRLISRGRRGGKTTKAIEIANNTGAYLLVRDRQAALAIAHLTKRFPVTFDEFFKDRMQGSYVKKIVIDDANEFIQRAVGPLTIEALSGTFLQEFIVRDKNTDSYLEQSQERFVLGKFED